MGKVTSASGVMTIMTQGFEEQTRGLDAQSHAAGMGYIRLSSAFAQILFHTSLVFSLHPPSSFSPQPHKVHQPREGTRKR